MPTIRDTFHTIANWHHKITMTAGCTKELYKIKPLGDLSNEDLKKEQERLVALLEKIETDAVNASQQITQLKEAIYKKIDPETQV